jgi:hypothetical protein
LGEIQPAHEPVSSEHWKVEPLSLAVNAKLALVAVVVRAGPDLILVVGATVSVGASEATTAEDVGVEDVGVGGPAGVLARSRGFVLAATSAPSPKPSRSVSNFLGLVPVPCSSVRLLSPSRSGSAWRERILVGTDLVVTRSVTVTARAAFTLLCLSPV